MAKELTDSMELTEGLAICPGRLAKENRLKTLFVKGVVVYLLAVSYTHLTLPTILLV